MSLVWLLLGDLASLDVQKILKIFQLIANLVGIQCHKNKTKVTK